MWENDKSSLNAYQIFKIKLISIQKWKKNWINAFGGKGYMNWWKEEWRGYMKKVTPRVLLRKLKIGKLPKGLII